MITTTGLLFNLYFSYLILIPSYLNLTLEHNRILKIPFSITNVATPILLARLTIAIL